VFDENVFLFFALPLTHADPPSHVHSFLPSPDQFVDAAYTYVLPPNHAAGIG
jgi:hypothetical protein